MRRTTRMWFIALIFLIGFSLFGCSHSLRRERRSSFGERSGLFDPIAQSERVAKSWVSHWLWPLKQVQVTSGYGLRDQELHEGIDLRAKIGTWVYAVEEGKVIYADSRISGYGKMIVIKHAGGLSSVYGHNSQFLVRAGQRVKRGQKIALSGNTGRSRGPHLHFEVRHGVVALDPLRLYSSPPTFQLGPQRRLASAKKRR